MTAIKGMSELKAAFKELGQKFGKNTVVGVALAAQSYANDVKVLSPYKTGTLRRSIHAEPPEEVKGAVVCYVGTDLPYARRLEFGFADKDKKGRTYNQPARPYFRPPLDQNRDKYLKIITEQMTR
ncbi:MAG: HK97-gp10 family putative phage morphogenesis protein [Methanoregula sp.]